MRPLILAAALGLAALPAAADDTMLVLDGSGSMWGQIDGVAKIEIAREVMGGLLDAMPAEERLGLVAYGHRREGDCTDIEVVADMGADRAAIRAAVDGLKPKGKTPLSAAVIMAAEHVGYTERAARVVLVSDGVETCDLDPCEVGRKLEEAGVDITVHVVGFGLASPEEEAGLMCLAEETGGRYLPASNAEELEAALENTAAEIKPEPATATLVAPESAPAGSEIEVTWTGPDERADQIAILDGKPGREVRRNGRPTEQGNPVTIRLLDREGSQEVVYFQYLAGAVIARATVEAAPVTATLDAPGEAPAGSTVDVAWTGPDYVSDYIGVFEPGAEDSERINVRYTQAGSPAKLVMPVAPGDYEVRYVLHQSRRALATRMITVTPVDATLDFAATAPAGALLAVTWTGPGYDADYIAVYEPGAPDAERINVSYTRAGSPLELRLPDEVGVYEVRYVVHQDREVLATRMIETTPVSASLSLPEAAPAGSTIPVTWEGPDYRSDYIGIYKPGDPDAKRLKVVYTAKGSPVDLQLPDEVGTYEARYVLHQSREVLAAATVATTPVTASVSAPENVAPGGDIPVTWEGPDYRADYIGLYKPGDPDAKRIVIRQTSRGDPAILEAPDEPGIYEIRYVLHQSRATLAATTIEVR